jgi:hypothetical protein
MKYEVHIKYEGTSTYLVEASSWKEAEDIATKLYYDGEDPDNCGGDYENITDIDTNPVA